MKALMLAGLMVMSMVSHAYSDGEEETVMVCTNDGQGCRVIIVYPM